MNRDVADRWCERGILILVLAILVFAPLAYGAARMSEFLVVQGLSMCVMAVWALRIWINPRTQLLFPPICWAVLAFAIYAIGRYLTSDIEYAARLEMIRVLIYAFLFFVILNNLHRQESTQIIVFTLVFVAMANAFYAVFQFVTDSDRVLFLVSDYKHRGGGTFYSPNHLAGHLEMILPLGLAYTLASRIKPLMKVLIGYASLSILAGIAVTVSRGGWISTGLALLVFFAVLFARRSHRLASFVLLVAIFGAGLFFIPRTYFFQTRLKQLVSDGKVDDGTRFELWRPAIQLWQENILWGIGPDHYDYRYRMYRPESVQLQPTRVHNDYLNTLTDWGIVGAALVASAWVFLYLGVLKTWRFVRGSPGDFEGKASNKFALVLGGSLGLLAILAHSAVDFNMHVPANAILAVTLMALVSGSLRFATDSYWVTPPNWSKAIITLVLLGGIGYLGWQEMRRATEYVWLERGKRTRDLPGKISSLEKSFAAEPMNFKTTYAIGEAFRMQSWDADDNEVEMATNAMHWYSLGMKLNAYDGYNYMRYGMCLDRVFEKHDEAWPYFSRAESLDPNGYFTIANIGWHYVQVQNYAAAKVWFQRSLRLSGRTNEIANEYLAIANKRMLEAATNNSRLKVPFR